MLKYKLINRCNTNPHIENNDLNIKNILNQLLKY